jgi:hypothetical protein
MTLISTLTASSSATLSWTGLNGYSKYLLILQNIFPAASNPNLNMQFGTGSGPTYITSSYFWSVATITGTGISQGGGTSIADMGISSTIGSFGGTAGLSGFVYIEGMTSGNYASMNFQNFYSPSVASSVTMVGGGNQGSDTNAKTAIKIYMSSGNINTGTASLYGISS